MHRNRCVWQAEDLKRLCPFANFLTLYSSSCFTSVIIPLVTRGRLLQQTTVLVVVIFTLNIGGHSSDLVNVESFSGGGEGVWKHWKHPRFWGILTVGSWCHCHQESSGLAWLQQFILANRHAGYWVFWTHSQSVITHSWKRSNACHLVYPVVEEKQLILHRGRTTRPWKQRRLYDTFFLFPGCSRCLLQK